MTVSKAYNAVLEYNPLSLAVEGVSLLSKKENLNSRVLAAFLSVLPAILAYFTSKFSAANLPRILAVLSPLEFAAVTFAVSFLVLSVCYGIMSKSRPEMPAS